MPFENSPSASVIMGVRYQRKDLALLERAVQSILSQTFSDFEFLICQNGSTPEAIVMLKNFCEEDPRISLIDGSGTNTLAQKLNRCISQARGRWIVRMDDDDYSEPERLEKQIAYLCEHLEIAFVGCFVRLVQDGTDVSERRLPENPSVKDFLFTQPFIHPALVFRKEVLDAVGGYCEAPYCDGCEDYDLLLRLYEHGFVGTNLKQAYLVYTLPPRRTGNRTFSMRLHEMHTRFVRFHSLGLLPGALPFVIKPVLVGLIPAALLSDFQMYRRKRKL